MKSLLLLLVLLVAVPASAQVGPDQWGKDHLEWVGHEHVIDVLSTIAAGTALIVPCFTDLTLSATETVTCLRKQGIQLGIGIAVIEIFKRTVKRQRPDGSDHLSFPSGHTYVACVSTLRSKWFAVCPAVGIQRVMAGKHWLTDTAGGAAAAAGLVTFHWGK